MNYMLDTNTISDILRNGNGVAAERFWRALPGTVGTSIVVSAELKYGYQRAASRRLEFLVESFLATFPVADWTGPCDVRYAQLRTDLERRGLPIGAMDMLIAAHALTLGAVLVTDNEREFRRVAGLQVENWVRQGA